MLVIEGHGSAHKDIKNEADLLIEEQNNRTSLAMPSRSHSRTCKKDNNSMDSKGQPILLEIAPGDPHNCRIQGCSWLSD